MLLVAEVGTMPHLTKLLEDAIAKVVEVPDGDQDAAADALFAHLASRDRRYHLAPEHVADVGRIQQDLRDGRARLAADEDVAAISGKS
jgi:hypothetical protein